MKIYTKTGDRGETGLFGGPRVGKDDPRVEAYGSVDEANAALGAARALGPDPAIDEVLARAQAALFAVGAELATPADARVRATLPRVDPAWAVELERAMDRWDAELPPLAAFVLPGGSPLAAALHLARTACRRAERRAVAAARAGPVDPEVVVYLNRLSDCLFVAARLANRRAGVAEPTWAPRRDGPGGAP